MEYKEKLTKHIYQDGFHEFEVVVDFAKLDPALFVKAIRSVKKRAILGHGALSVTHKGKVTLPKKLVAP